MIRSAAGDRSAQRPAPVGPLVDGKKAIRDLGRKPGGSAPMKYWIDTEYIAKPFSLDLVSIGLVAEDGREFYAESSEVDWSKASPWTLENVRPQLDGKGTPRGDRLRRAPLHRR